MTTTTTIYYVVRNTNDHELLQKMKEEQDAVNLAGYFNKKYNAEVAEVVKIVETIETSVL